MGGILAFALALRALIQAVVFILSATALGVDLFGALVLVLAVSGILAPISSMGGEYLVLRAFARAESEQTLYLGQSWFCILVLGGILSLLATLFLILYMHIDTTFWVVSFICVAEIVLNRWSELLLRVLQARENVERLALARVILPLCRLLMIGLAILFVDTFSLSAWAISNAVAALIGVVFLRYQMKVLSVKVFFSSEKLGRNLVDGFAFVWGGLFHRIGNDADKVIISKLTSLSSAGIYGAGYRIVEMLMIPAQALVTSNTAKVYRSFEGSLGEGRSNLNNLLAKVASVNVVLALGLILLGGLVVGVLGTGYEQSEVVIAGLAFLPFLIGVRITLSVAMQAMNKQNLNSMLLMIFAIANVLFTWLFISKFGWVGAIASTMVVEGFLSLACLLIVMKLTKAK